MEFNWLSPDSLGYKRGDLSNSYNKKQTNQKKANTMSDIYLADKASFDAAVAATADGGKPLVIDFTASWCPPCKRIGPIYEGHVANYPELVMKKLDVDANSEAAQAAGIQAMPTFKVYKNGAEVETMRGASDQGLIDLLNRAKGEWVSLDSCLSEVSLE